MELGRLNQFIDLTYDIASQGHKLFDAGDPNSDYQKLANDLLLLKMRLNKPELYILIGGEVKVGKSTFINCIVGEDICPSADVVCTNVPSIIRYGESEKAIVHYKPDENGNIPESKEITRIEIPQYSTEKKNTRNSESVEYIEIFVDNPMLKKGLVFIDTPGLGALDPQHAAATYNVASQADMILFLGNTDKELSSFEIESFKQLIECSKCGFIAHILTCCDRGDADAIYTQNTKALKSAFPTRDIKTMRVSSLLYKKYEENNNPAYLKKSGYEEVFSFIKGISETQKDILCTIGVAELSVKVESLRAKITTIKETAENPHKFEQRLKTLENCKNRLRELADKSAKWKASFDKKQSDMQSEIVIFINDSEKRIYDDIDELLKSDTYLNSGEMLTSAIQAKLTTFKNDLDQKIKTRMMEIYLDVRNETGFTELQETIHTPGFDISEMKLPENCGEISKFNTFKSHVGSFMIGGLVAHGIGVTATALSIGIPAMSAKIGALVGTIAPGIGNLIGAFGGFILGGLIALAISFFQSKDSKRKKMAADCKKHLGAFFTQVRAKVSAALSDNRYLLSTQFAQELSDQKSDCETKIKQLQPIVATAKANWNGLVEMLGALDNLSKVLSKK